ncbi:MAG: PqqD family protein [Candidatus Sumerlaeia bacterium]
MLFGKKTPPLSREAAISARPEQLSYVRRKERDDGGMEVTVNMPRTGFLRVVGGKGTVERTFGLDPLGREVYEACDGKKTVRNIAKKFAKKHHVSQSEGEIAVTTYLKTLMTKNLVAVAVDKKAMKK